MSGRELSRHFLLVLLRDVFGFRLLLEIVESICNAGEWPCTTFPEK